MNTVIFVFNIFLLLLYILYLSNIALDINIITYIYFKLKNIPNNNEFIIIIIYSDIYNKLKSFPCIFSDITFQTSSLSDSIKSNRVLLASANNEINTIIIYI